MVLHMIPPSVTPVAPLRRYLQGPTPGCCSWIGTGWCCMGYVLEKMVQKVCPLYLHMYKAKLFGYLGNTTLQPAVRVLIVWGQSTLLEHRDIHVCVYAYDTIHATYIHVRSAVHSCTLYKAYSYMCVSNYLCFVLFCFALTNMYTNMPTCAGFQSLVNR